VKKRNPMIQGDMQRKIKSQGVRSFLFCEAPTASPRFRTGRTAST